MRLVTVGSCVLCVFLGFAAGVVVAAGPARSKVTNLLHTALSERFTPGREVLVDLVEIPPNTALDRHWHPGEEFHYYLDGEPVIEIEGRELARPRLGTVGHVPFETRHRASAGEAGATILVFRVHETGEPWRYLEDGADDARDAPTSAQANDDRPPTGNDATRSPAATPEAAALAANETAFAKTMVDRDFAAFASFIHDDAVFISGGTPVRGKEAILAQWKAYFDGPAAPFAWSPEIAEVSATTGLGYTQGPVRSPDGSVRLRFSSVWQAQPDGSWKIVFDNGYRVCSCATAP